MIPFTINEIDFVVKENISILEACKCVGVKIPRFCYHEALSIAGNCRMCLVRLLLFNDDGEETEDIDDALVISCVTLVDSEMEVFSNDPMIQKAREEILEFLLLNHPLDCPICDQGGECDLQDQTKHFGSNRSKFFKNKVGVEDKDFGIFIKSIMTRCIHCTRCVRFSSEVAGVDFFGTLNRGGHTEIGTYYSNVFNSEISANVIDLCPVGALTSKPYSFKVRPWELKSIETIDLTDSLGSNIYIHYTESDILRVLPKFNSDINETLITDKTRFAYDSFSTSFLADGVFEFSNFNKNAVIDEKSLILLFDSFLNKKCTIIISEELSFEELNLLRKVAIQYSNISVRFLKNTLDNNFKNNIFFNNEFISIKNLSETKNSVFLFATNLKTESSLINVRLRHLASFVDYLNLYSLGFKFNDSLLKNSFLNCNFKYIISFLEGRLKTLSLSLITSEKALLVFGSSFSNRGYSFKVLKEFFYKLNPSLLLFNVFLHSNSSLSTYFNFKQCNSNDLLKSNFLIFIKCRETSFLKRYFLSNYKKTLVWLNSYSLKFSTKNGYQIALKHIYEEKNIFFNCEFRPQLSHKIIEKRPKSSFLFDLLKNNLRIKNSKSISNNFVLEFLENPNFFSENEKKDYLLNISKLFNNDLEKVFLKKYPFKPIFSDFYQTTYLTDFSKNILAASKYYNKNFHNFF